MEGAWKKYVRAFKNDLDAWAVWEPGTPVELYDYGVVEGGRWSKLGSLWDLLPRNEKDASEESEPAELTFGSASVSDIDAHAEIPGGIASVKVHFGSRDSLYVRAYKSVHRGVANLQNLSDRIVGIKDQWKRKWFLVTGVRSASKFTVLAASESNSEVKVSATVADLQSFLMGSISTSAGVHFAGNMSFSFLGRSGPIHIDLVRLRVRWWSGEEALRRFGQAKRSLKLSTMKPGLQRFAKMKSPDLDDIKFDYGIPYYLLRELKRRNALPLWWGMMTQDSRGDWVNNS